MKFNNAEEIIALLQANETAPLFIREARKYNKKLEQLIKGKDFKSLIVQLHNVESSKRSEARKLYSRSIKDFFERLFNPLNNVYSAVGGVKKYDIKNAAKRKEFMSLISNINDGKSLEKWIQNNWLKNLHTDPNGVIVYNVIDGKISLENVNINKIRTYKAKGQLVEYIVFEPETIELNGSKIEKIRVIDDENDYIFEKNDKNYKLLEDESFAHYFRECPVIINSPIEDDIIRLSPVDSIIELAEQYLSFASVKTIYQYTKGTPIHWRLTPKCPHCHGTGKTSDGICGFCDGLGRIVKNDVADVVAIDIPEKDDVKITPEIAGHIAPPIDFLEYIDKDLANMDSLAYSTFWGLEKTTSTNETATGRYIDVQPKLNKLNWYADISQWIEWKLSSLLMNNVNMGLSETKCMITYGRKYILENPEALLDVYTRAKEKIGDSIITQSYYDEYLTAKYKNDAEYLSIAILRSKLEPYLHYTITEVRDIMGEVEAMKKVLFGEWFKLLTDDELQKDKITLAEEFQFYVDLKISENGYNDDPNDNNGTKKIGFK